MITNEFYENPLDYGVFHRFEDAIQVLCTGSGSLNKRLYYAYYSCCIFHLFSNNFKDEFIRENLYNVEKIAKIGLQRISKIKLPSDYCISPRQFDLHWRQSTKMANCIFQIYRYLVELRITNAQVTEQQEIKSGKKIQWKIALL
ncbi:MAG: hypothetical protein ACI4OR_00720 [Alphaproteobacteria bacterium]